MSLSKDANAFNHYGSMVIGGSPYDRTPERIAEYAEKAVPQMGGNDGKLRIICFPAVPGSNGIQHQEIWHDAFEGAHPRHTQQSYRVSPREKACTPRDFHVSTYNRVHRDLFEAVWTEANRRKQS